MQNAIAIEKLNKFYGALHVLRDVSLHIAPGEFYGLLGINGAGKSTLINTIAGLIKPQSGSVEVMGFNVQKQFRQARSHLGLVPQELVNEPFFSLKELLHVQSGYFGLRNNGAWIDQVLAHMGLTEKADASMSALSGGMKRRMLIAMAIVHKPQVIILDEPTAGVDVNKRRQIWRFIRSLHQQGHTIILTTHYLEEAETLCDRIGVIQNGSIVMEEKTSDLLNRYKGQRLEDIFINIVGEGTEEEG